MEHAQRPEDKQIDEENTEATQRHTKQMKNVNNLNQQLITSVHQSKSVSIIR